MSIVGQHTWMRGPLVRSMVPSIGGNTPIVKDVAGRPGNNPLNRDNPQHYSAGTTITATAYLL